MAKVKKETSTIASVYAKYLEARKAVKNCIEEIRLSQCIEGDCKENDLPSIDRLLIIGKDNDGVYWMFDEDAFYWSATIELPVMYNDGKMYINPSLEDIDHLVKKKLLQQYVVVTSIA